MRWREKSQLQNFIPETKISPPPSFLYSAISYKIGSLQSRLCCPSNPIPDMPRGKKKATAAQAPPSTPPASKRRKTSSVTAKSNVNVASPEDKDGAQPKTRSSTRNAKTYKPFM